MSLTEESAEAPAYGLFVQREGKQVCTEHEVRGSKCAQQLNAEIVSQKAALKKYRKGRVCKKGVCSLPNKNKLASEKEGAVYKKGSPKPYKHIISATWGREDVTDLAQQLYYDGHNAFFANKDIWRTKWDHWLQTFTLTYRNGGKIFRAVIGEGDHREIALGEAKPNAKAPVKDGVVAAYWGRSDVTGKARAMYKSTHKFNAHHFIWGDSFYGQMKTLVVVTAKKGVFSTGIAEQAKWLKLH
jgi:hypothetical protein